MNMAPIRAPSHSSIDFQVDWLPPPEDAGFPLYERATWASVRIECTGRVLTRHVDMESHRLREAIYCSPLPIALWALENWLPIFFDESWPGATRANSVLDALDLTFHVAAGEGEYGNEDAAEHARRWWERRSLRGGRAGTALPEVVFWRQGARLVLEWKQDEVPFAGSNVLFLCGTGQVEVPALDVVDGLLDLADRVMQRIAGEGIGPGEDRVIDRFVDTYRLVRRDEAFLKRCVLAQTGMGEEGFGALVPPDGGESAWTAALALLELSPPDLRSVSVGSGVTALFRSMGPGLRAEDVKTLIDVVRKHQSESSAPERLLDLQSHALSALEAERRLGLAPWAVGQGWASAIRKLLGMGGDEPVDIEVLLGDLEVPIESCRLEDPGVDAASLWSTRAGPVVAINENAAMGGTPWGRRMALAHEFCHLLFDRDVAGGLGVASGRGAPLLMEKRANAFAAEFLLPRGALEAFRGAVDQKEALRRLMDRYRVGRTVAGNQLYNHGLITEVERDAMLSEG